MNIRESNMLIAEFMGMRQGIIIDEIGYYHPNELEYHIYWDWLMPVVEKISLYKYDDGESAYPRTFGMPNEETGGLMFRFNRMGLHEDETLIEAAYSACVEWIVFERKEANNE